MHVKLDLVRVRYLEWPGRLAECIAAGTIAGTKRGPELPSSSSSNLSQRGVCAFGVIPLGERFSALLVCSFMPSISSTFNAFA